MTNLSPKAKAIMEAYETTYTESGLVAALREAVNQLQYQSFHHTEEYYQLDARAILDVADELEAHYG